MPSIRKASKGRRSHARRRNSLQSVVEEADGEISESTLPSTPITALTSVSASTLPEGLPPKSPARRRYSGSSTATVAPALLTSAAENEVKLDVKESQKESANVPELMERKGEGSVFKERNAAGEDRTQRHTPMGKLQALQQQNEVKKDDGISSKSIKGGLANMKRASREKKKKNTRSHGSLKGAKKKDKAAEISERSSAQDVTSSTAAPNRQDQQNMTMKEEPRQTDNRYIDEIAKTQIVLSPKEEVITQTALQKIADTDTEGVKKASNNTVREEITLALEGSQITEEQESASPIQLNGPPLFIHGSMEEDEIAGSPPRSARMSAEVEERLVFDQDNKNFTSSSTSSMCSFSTTSPIPTAPGKQSSGSGHRPQDTLALPQLTALSVRPVNHSSSAEEIKSTISNNLPSALSIQNKPIIQPNAGVEFSNSIETAGKPVSVRSDPGKQQASTIFAAEETKSASSVSKSSKQLSSADLISQRRGGMTSLYFNSKEKNTTVLSERSIGRKNRLLGGPRGDENIMVQTERSVGQKNHIYGRRHRNAVRSGHGLTIPGAKTAHSHATKISRNTTNPARSKNGFLGSNLTALHVAVRDSNIAAVQALIWGGVDVNAINDHGYTPLHLAVLTDEDVALLALISAHADITACDSNLNMPIHLAIVEGCFAATRAILPFYSTSIIFHARNVDGKTPYDLMLEAKADNLAVACLERCYRTEYSKTGKGRSVRLSFHLSPLLNVSPPGFPDYLDFNGKPLSWALPKHSEYCSSFYDALYATLRANLSLVMGHPVLSILISSKWKAYGLRKWAKEFCRYLFFLTVYILCGFQHASFASTKYYSHLSSISSHGKSTSNAHSSHSVSTPLSSVPAAHDSSSKEPPYKGQQESTAEIRGIIGAFVVCLLLFVLSMRQFLVSTVTRVRKFGLWNSLSSVWKFCNALMALLGMLGSFLFFIELTKYARMLYTSPAEYRFEPYYITASILCFGIGLAVTNIIDELCVFSAYGTMARLMELVLMDWGVMLLAIMCLSGGGFSIGIMYLEDIDPSIIAPTGLRASYLFLFSRHEELDLTNRDLKTLEFTKIIFWEFLAASLITAMVNKTYRTSFEKAKQGALLSKGMKIVEYELQMSREQYRRVTMSICPVINREYSGRSVFAQALDSLTPAERLERILESLKRVEGHIMAFQVSLERNVLAQTNLMEELRRCQTYFADIRQRVLDQIEERLQQEKEKSLANEAPVLLGAEGQPFQLQKPRPSLYFLEQERQKVQQTKPG